MKKKKLEQFVGSKFRLSKKEELLSIKGGASSAMGSGGSTYMDTAMEDKCQSDTSDEKKVDNCYDIPNPF